VDYTGDVDLSGGEPRPHMFMLLSPSPVEITSGCRWLRADELSGGLDRVCPPTHGTIEIAYELVGIDDDRGSNSKDGVKTKVR
jgi:hypothetical protein